MDNQSENASVLVESALVEMQRGNSIVAIECLEKAAYFEPNNLKIMELLVRCYLRFDKAELAITWLNRLVEKSPLNSAYYHSLANALSQMGRFDEAVTIHEQLLRMRDSANAHYNFAVFLQKIDRHERAIAEYETALGAGIDRPEEVLLNMANSFIAVADKRKAIDVLEKAISLNEQFTLAHINLATLFSEFGEREKVARHYRIALKQDPGCGQAFERLANAGLIPDDDPAFKQAVAAHHSHGVDVESRISFCFGLGKICNDSERYDEAFSYYTKANKLRSMCCERYSAANQETLISKIMAQCSEDWLSEKPGNADIKPIFVFGMFRSGSTLLEQVLGRHSKITCGGELSFFPNCIKTTLNPFPESLSMVGEEMLRSIASAYSDCTKRLNSASEMFTDKRPDNFLAAGLLRRLFPQAKFVHTVRNPLDTALSIYFQNLHPELGYAVDLLDIGHYMVQYRRLMAHWMACFPDAIHEISYDAFVISQREQTRQLLEFCGLEWEEGCLAFHQAENAVNTASIWQVRKPVYRSSSGRWKNYQGQLGQLQRLFESNGIEYQ